MATQQVALITGASTGIGSALAQQFAFHDYAVIMVAQNADELAQTAGKLRDKGAQVTEIALDLAEPDAAEKLCGKVREHGLQVDVLVNNAGVGQREVFHQGDLDKDVEIIRLNIETLVRLSKHYLREMVQRDAGYILNLGSVAGFQPGPLLAVYHASKAFVVSFSEALAEELRDTNVTVTVLCPGPTDTEFFRRADMENARILADGIVMDPEEVARIGYEGLMKGERVVIPGLSNRIMTFSRRLIPQSLQSKFHRKAYEVKEEG